MTRGESSPASAQPIAPGLYLVATPIGNLEDITLRALRVLRGVDSIACEDTRVTQKLLNFYGIETPTVSYHEHNEQARAAELVAKLASGARIAVVSDAGTPCISDPGAALVRAAIAAGIPVIPVPGANAAVTALAASGLDTERFLFAGFLPSKPGERRTQLEQLALQPHTVILYEAPHRILGTLEEVERLHGGSGRIVLARELTKIHEEFLRGTASQLRAELASRTKVRGEFVLLLEPAPSQPVVPNHVSLAGRVEELMREGLDRKEALKRSARERGLSKSEAYREYERQRVPGRR